MRIVQNSTLCAGLTIAIAPVAGWSQPVQETGEQPVMEEIVVTGSYIRRPTQADSPAPLRVITQDDLSALGVNKISDVIERLTINTGSQNNPDAFTQNFTTGTSNINLRGLGVSSTLVMINGRRQTQSAAATDRGENFVDTSSLPPMIAFDRIETLKDGATALYGSEAVAGVVNFITRSNFEGFDLQLEFQGVDEHPQEDSQISGIYGVGNDTTHFLAAFSVLDRSQLTTNDRRLSGPTDDLSQAGNPGSFLVPSLPGNPVYGLIWTGAFDSNLNGVADALEPQLGLPAVPGAQLPVFADPDCTTIAAQDPKVVPDIAASVPSPIGDIPIGLCQFDFGSTTRSFQTSSASPRISSSRTISAAACPAGSSCISPTTTRRATTRRRSRLRHFPKSLPRIPTTPSARTSTSSAACSAPAAKPCRVSTTPTPGGLPRA